MIFEKIHTVPTSDELVGKAFRRASRAMSGKQITGRESAMKANESMVLTAGNILSDNLANIVRRFPSFDELPGFYYEIADILVGVDKLRQSLSSTDWASKKIHELSREFVMNIRKSDSSMKTRKEAFGRMASIMSSIDSDLRFLNDARNQLRKLPDVREEPTIVVAGYPSVGKSSVMAVITGARPEVASCPFTSRGFSIGHFERNNDRYQVMDTPGLLDRPMSDRNDVELQAITALKHLESVVLFILDASETCGYVIDDQKRLLDEVRENFELPILVVANKADLPQFQEPDIVDLVISTETKQGVDAVVDQLIEMLAKEKESSPSVTPC